jgi:hypothetical protein
MRLGSPRRDSQSGGDGLIGEPFGDQLSHHELTGPASRPAPASRPGSATRPHAPTRMSDLLTSTSARSLPQAHIPYTARAPRRDPGTSPRSRRPADRPARRPRTHGNGWRPPRRPPPVRTPGQPLHETAEGEQLQLPAQVGDPARVAQQRRASACRRVGDPGRGCGTVADPRRHPPRPAQHRGRPLAPRGRSRTGQPSSAASRPMSTPASALLTGHDALA